MIKKLEFTCVRQDYTKLELKTSREHENDNLMDKAFKRLLFLGIEWKNKIT